jgi:hypothetical protein
MAQRQGTEGRIAGQGDAEFHGPILGDDRLPPALLERLREQAQSAGLNLALVQR